MTVAGTAGHGPLAGVRVVELAGIGPGPFAAMLLADHKDPARWAGLREVVAARFKTRMREEWTAVFEGSDACVAPVLSLSEAPHHPHLAARGTFSDHGGITQPAPAPRFSATPTSVRGGPAQPGADTEDVARDWDVPGLLQGGPV